MDQACCNSNIAEFLTAMHPKVIAQINMFHLCCGVLSPPILPLRHCYANIYRNSKTAMGIVYLLRL